MKIYKITLQFGYSKPVYVVCDNLTDAERLIYKNYPESLIVSGELVSENIINMWAQ